MVVDDEPDILNLVSLILENEGYTVLKVSSGPSAISLAQKEKPDLILLDIMMPGMDGWETLRILNSNPETSSIPVVILTCRSGTYDRILGIQENAVDYITKPFTPDNLVERVKNIIEQ